MPPRRGRPKSGKSMEDRVLVRMDKATKAALEAYADKTGMGAESTAARVIIVERLRREGLL